MANFKKKVGFYLMRKVKSKALRDKMSSLQANKIGKILIPKNIGKPMKLDINSLKEKGYVDLGKLLSEKEVNDLKQQIDPFKCYDPFRKNLGNFKSNQIPEVVATANYRRDELVTIDSILKIANNSDVLEAVKEFLGATPTISNVNMWWSLAEKEKAEQAQLFHRDVDDFKFCKLFVYLTDVDMKTGPHVYVEGSSASKKLLKIRRYQDAEIENAFGKDSIKYFTARKGSSFIVDTYGFHKGLLPEEGNRLLLQVQYSLNPIGIESYNPVDVGEHPYDPYINRLIIKSP